MRLCPGLLWFLKSESETHICAMDPEKFTSWQAALSGRHHPGIMPLSCPQNKTGHWIRLNLFPDTSASLHHIREIQPHFKKVPHLSFQAVLLTERLKPGTTLGAGKLSHICSRDLSVVSQPRYGVAPQPRGQPFPATHTRDTHSLRIGAVWAERQGERWSEYPQLPHHLLHTTEGPLLICVSKLHH